MKAMTRPCRLSPRSLLHTSSTCLNKPDLSTSPTKTSANPQQELDFFKAADILFSEENPKRRKKFGWDFHLWQAFVACLPSVAVYLTAQYARWDIRRMEAEREREAAEKREIEEKRQDEESIKMPGFRVLHQRLDKIEEKISEMESKTAQSAAAVDGKMAKVEKEEKTAKEVNADVSTERQNDTKAPKMAAQNALIKKEDLNDCNEEPVKAQLKVENLQKQASTTGANEKSGFSGKTPEDTSNRK